ncbi:MAG: hypothetical protein QXQ14_02360 [Candidatus Aenigmatarchaeota archaeon]
MKYKAARVKENIKVYHIIFPKAEEVEFKKEEIFSRLLSGNVDPKIFIIPTKYEIEKIISIIFIINSFCPIFKMFEIKF